MKKSLLALLAVLICLGVAVAQEEPNVLWVVETASGKVWANLSLTRQRVGEQFLPMAIGIQNKQKGNVLIDRNSVWLTDLDGVVYTMPSVKILRKNYDRLTVDHRMVSFGGIPWEVWYRGRRFASSNFFPDMRATRGNTTRDRITLREGFAMFDLLYFEKPREFVLGKPFYLNVAPEKWEEPIRVQILLS